MVNGSSDVLKNVISIIFQSKSDHIKHTNRQYKNIPDEGLLIPHQSRLVEQLTHLKILLRYTNISIC